MSLTDKIEDKLGIKIEKLSPQEKETYFSMLDIVNKSQITPEKFRDYIISMKESVEKELVKEPEFKRIFIFKVENRNQIYLKARLHNYMLIEAFLISPEKAKERLEDMVGNITGGI